ncbi:MAG: cob(I)yrinic acid a,c-diamide adenosyltransferase, partial [Acidimicrobiia bacterium]|nr:cob(I)yrinic acid a,c-diamide adenosyltransferase [Acidimicrobiia bacterium]
MTDHEQPPVDKPDTSEARTAPSLVLVNTGAGKGKSTAAFGTALRALALGWPVAVVQFLKSGGWQVGEERICRELGVDWFAEGDGFTWNSEDLGESAALAQAAWARAKNLITSDKYRLVVLDEISYALTWGWVDIADVVETLVNRPKRTSVILT